MKPTFIPKSSKLTSNKIIIIKELQQDTQSHNPRVRSLKRIFTEKVLEACNSSAKEAHVRRQMCWLLDGIQFIGKTVGFTPSHS